MQVGVLEGRVIADLLSRSHGRTHSNNGMKETVPLLPTPCGMSFNYFVFARDLKTSLYFNLHSLIASRLRVSSYKGSGTSNTRPCT